MKLVGKNFLITGGTGSFGRTLCDYLLKNDVNEIRIFSRDENKQHQMRREIKDLRVTFFKLIKSYLIYFNHSRIESDY